MCDWICGYVVVLSYTLNFYCFRCVNEVVVIYFDEVKEYFYFVKERNTDSDLSKIHKERDYQKF